jgi:hypothetical protein
MAADKYGNKELLAVSDGYRESKLGWKEMEILSNLVDWKSHILQHFTMQPPPQLTLHQQTSYSPVPSV